jgi:hypothetical protein
MSMPDFHKRAYNNGTYSKHTSYVKRVLRITPARQVQGNTDVRCDIFLSADKYFAVAGFQRCTISLQRMALNSGAKPRRCAGQILRSKAIWVD